MDKLRTWRKGQKITAQEAGAKVGVSGVQWTRYETGERTIGIDRIAAVAELTGISPRELCEPSVVEAIDRIANVTTEPAQ